MKWKVFLIFILAGYATPVGAQELKSVKITEVEQVIAASNTPLIVNMWATWCKPCVEEIPYFIEEINKKKDKGDSIRLLLVSLDFKEAFPSEVLSFATKRKFTAPIFWLDETNADFFCPRIDQQWSGAIPATLFINNNTGYRKFIEGKIKHDEFKEEIKHLLNSKL